MRRRFLRAMLAWSLLLLSVFPVWAAEHPFVDVPEDAWFAGNVDYVYHAGWMNGTSETTFSPDAPMTRGMLAAVLYRYDGGLERAGSAPFTDLKAGAYYVDAVNWAYENGIVLGMTEDTFCPDISVTREQIVTMFYRYAHHQGRDMKKNGSLAEYPDVTCVSEYALEAFSWAVAEGIIKGNAGWLDPRENALRSQCAAIVQRFDCGGETDADGENNTPVEHRYNDLYVLMYHSVAPDGTKCGDWTITESKFRDHMQWLKENGYATVLPGELAAGKPIPQKAVLITFDDGYKDNYTLAYPILQEFGCKAVVFAIVEKVDRDPDYLTWNMCREMESSGLVEIGSHTYGLHLYPGIQRVGNESQAAYEQRVLTDIEKSYRLLQRHLGKTPTAFAYPHGIVDSWAEEYIEGLFPVTMRVDFVVKNDITRGLWDLSRVNVNDTTQLSRYLP